MAGIIENHPELVDVNPEEAAIYSFLVRERATPARAISEKRIALDFKVILADKSTPEIVYSSGPIENRGFPGNVKGTTSHKKKIKPLTSNSLLKTVPRFRRAEKTMAIPIKRAVINAAKLSEIAV